LLAAPTISEPARYKTRGERADRRRCARRRRFPGDCRTETFSNTGNGELRPNLSSEARLADDNKRERGKGTASARKRQGSNGQVVRVNEYSGVIGATGRG